MTQKTQQIQNWIQQFIEKEQPLYNNLPTCPFAKKARKNQTIEMKTVNLKQIQTYLHHIEQYKHNKNEALLLIEQNTITNQEIENITDILTEIYHQDLQLFAFHPQSQFEMQGLYTRQMPTPSIIIHKHTDIEKKETLLKKTKYYDNLTQPNCTTTANHPNFTIKKTKRKGNGLYTNQEWQPNQNLFKLEGTRKPISESSPLAIQISEQECIESYPHYNDHQANHSCDPNCKIQFGPQIIMRTIKQIKAGEEITWDYETTEYDMSNCSFTCNCNSLNCRGIIIGAKYRHQYPAWKLAPLSR
jgi:hypothetical protein